MKRRKKEKDFERLFLFLFLSPTYFWGGTPIKIDCYFDFIGAIEFLCVDAFCHFDLT